MGKSINIVSVTKVTILNNYFYDNNTVGIRTDKFWKNIR